MVGVIRNFLNYLLHHDVCPEHKDQIDSARVLCDKATKELWNIASMTPVLPGDFNMACSEIFGGMYQGLYSTDQTWMGESDTLHSLGIGPERARQAFKIGIAANSSDEMFQIYRQQLSTKSCRRASTEETAFEITEIGHPTETVLGLYAQQQSAGLKTLGKMKAKTWSSANAPEEDITEAEEAFLKANPPKFKNYEFWVEEEILKNCEVGMKFEATVRETSFGLSYFDAIGGVYCSFYQLIPNNLMEDWREIEKEWLPPKYNKNKAAKREAEAQEVSAGGDEGQGNIEDHTEPLADEQGIEAITEEGKEGTEAEDTYVNANMVAAGYDEEVGKKKPETEEEPGDIDADSEETVERGFGVEVQKVGVEVKKVTGNARTVTQENFDVKRIDEVE